MCHLKAHKLNMKCTYLFGMSMNTKMSGQPSIKYQYILKYYKIYLGEMSVYSSYLNVKHQMRLQLSPHKLIPRRSFITHLVLHEPTKKEHRI